MHFCIELSLTSSQKFIEECNITSKLDHPNVLGLIGVSMNPEDGTLHMIMPFMDHGDVKSFLKSKRGDIIKLDHFPKVHAYCKINVNNFVKYSLTFVYHNAMAYCTAVGLQLSKSLLPEPSIIYPLYALST